MKFKGPMIVVHDMERAKTFYMQALGLHVILDFGANVTLTGGFSLQEKKLWQQFINKQDDQIVFGGNDFELYFEEDDFDGFIKKLSAIGGIEYVGEVTEAAWGQRTVRKTVRHAVCVLKYVRQPILICAAANQYGKAKTVSGVWPVCIFVPRRQYSTEKLRQNAKDTKIRIPQRKFLGIHNEQERTGFKTSDRQRYTFD